ncbi:MAG: hypothetical protein Q9159_007632 [Coniocarpon cinnabarinum]
MHPTMLLIPVFAGLSTFTSGLALPAAAAVPVDTGNTNNTLNKQALKVALGAYAMGLIAKDKGQLREVTAKLPPRGVEEAAAVQEAEAVEVAQEVAAVDAAQKCPPKKKWWHWILSPGYAAIQCFSSDMNWGD